MNAAGSGENITITVNDESRSIPSGVNVLGLVAALGLADKKGVAIAINGSVAPRAHWVGRKLAQGDKVVVIRATQGG